MTYEDLANFILNHMTEEQRKSDVTVHTVHDADQNEYFKADLLMAPDNDWLLLLDKSL